MNVPPSELAAVHLDRSDELECLLDNLRKCRTLDHQKSVLRAYEEGVRTAERQRLMAAVVRVTTP